MQNCTCCFEDWIGPCNGIYDAVTINTSLTPGEVYNWRITDKFGKIYQGEVVAEIDGKIIILCSALPEFLFTPFSGTFTIEILDGHCKPIKFALASEYDCVTLSINGGNSDKREIGCDLQCSGGGNTNVNFPFEDAEVLIIPWENYLDVIGNNPTVQVYQQDSYDPTLYALVAVTILQSRNVANILQAIEINFGGPMTGYVLIS